jgi:hypothetical protein
MRMYIHVNIKVEFQIGILGSIYMWIFKWQLRINIHVNIQMTIEDVYTCEYQSWISNWNFRINIHVNIQMTIEDVYTCEYSNDNWGSIYMWIFKWQLRINIHVNINIPKTWWRGTGTWSTMIFEYQYTYQYVIDPGASPPDPHAFGGTGFFHKPPVL